MSGLLEQALAAIRAEQPKAAQLGIRLIGVVGSVARGTASEHSDVDIVYDVIDGHQASLLDLGSVHADLKAALGRKIGVIDLSQVRDFWRIELERELVSA